jgi:hypothetical protein
MNEWLGGEGLDLGWKRLYIVLLLIFFSWWIAWAYIAASHLSCAG